VVNNLKKEYGLLGQFAILPHRHRQLWTTYCMIELRLRAHGIDFLTIPSRNTLYVIPAHTIKQTLDST
jgi:hypothetical protein